LSRATGGQPAALAEAGRRAVPGWRPGLPGLTSHRVLSNATATM